MGNEPEGAGTPRVQVVRELQALLGEGLHWCGVSQCLWMTDIHAARVWRWWPGRDAWAGWELPERVGWVLPTAGDPERLMLGLQSGMAVARFGARVSAPDFVARPYAQRPAMRLNDAKADSTGAVWAGSLNNDDESRADGELFRWGPDGSLRTADSGYTVANGPAIAPDERWMLHTDSGRRTIHAFDLDVRSGTLAGKRVWKQFTPEEGYPDGMCFDAEGAVWVAHWGAGCVSRFDPGGRLLQRVGLPVSQVTNVCFGGERLDRLFVSSARVGLGPRELARQPLAGALFEVLAPGVQGLPAHAAGRAGGVA